MKRPESPAAGPADQTIIRASQEERERAIETIKTAYVNDRLTQQEMEQRVAQILAARTRAAVTIATFDLPAEGPVASSAARKPAAWKIMSAEAGWATVLGVLLALIAGLFLIGDGVVIEALPVVWVGALAVALSKYLDARNPKANRRRPRTPARQARRTIARS